jgi:hypothetical protein
VIVAVGAIAVMQPSMSECWTVAVAGLKATVTPPGKPEADKLTLALKPFSG